MKNVLIVAYPFPPIEGGEVIRVEKFIKYLPHFGWNPIVLTLNMGKIYENYTVYGAPTTNFLHFGKKSTGATSHSTIFLKLSKFFLIPDGLMWWIPFAVNLGVRIARLNEVDMIYSVSPNHSNHIVAKKISEKTKIPWVADFKDPWISNPTEFYPTPIHKYFNHFLEKQVINHATKVVTVSKFLKDEFMSRYKNLPEGKFVVIPNGFDSEDFKGLYRKREKDDKIVIVHLGTFYGSRNPGTFLQAVRRLVDENAELKDRIKIRFVGKSRVPLKSLIESSDLEDSVEIIDFVPHLQSLQYLVDADILLLITGPGTATPTGKIFEYMASGKPILSLSPYKPVVSEILDETKDVIVDQGNVNEIFEGLKKLCNDILNEKTSVQSSDAIKQYDRRTLTEKLANLFDNLVSR